MVDRHLVPVPHSLHEHPRLDLDLVLAGQSRVAGSPQDLQDIIQAGNDVGVDWPRDVAVDRNPRPHLERQLPASYRLGFQVISARPVPVVVFMKTCQGA